MSNYTWRIKSMAKGIDPDLAIKEIERIENVYGGITPETVLEASREPDAVLYSLFQWDNDKAANQYRLQQARTLINNIEIAIISDGEAKSIPVFEIVNIGEGRVYKSITIMNPAEIDSVKASVKREITHLKNKLSIFNSFENVIKHLDKAIEEIK